MGSIAFEPLWLFYRSNLEVRRIPDLAGLQGGDRRTKARSSTMSLVTCSI